jgi:hypothetical protein
MDSLSQAEQRELSSRMEKKQMKDFMNVRCSQARPGKDGIGDD